MLPRPVSLRGSRGLGGLARAGGWLDHDSGFLLFRCVVVLHPGVLQVRSGEPIAQFSDGVQQLLAAMALAQDLLERRVGFCIGHQPLQNRPAHLLKAEMGSTSRELEPDARFPDAHCGAFASALGACSSGPGGWCRGASARPCSSHTSKLWRDRSFSLKHWRQYPHR